MTQTVDLGNNESLSIGIAETQGMYVALTRTQSKWFKTRAGAARWLAVRGYDENGERLPERPL